MSPVTSMNVLVTGGSRGIGLAMVAQLRAQGHSVVAVGRSGSTELNGTGARVIEGVDLAADEDRVRLLEALHGERFDWLLLNAGLLKGDGLEHVAEQAKAMEDQYRINAIAPIVLAAALAPQLGSGGKIGLITSRMGSIADNASGGYYGYRMSKAALNAGGRSLAHDLRSRGISVALLHPGFVRTAMTGHQGHIDPEQSARGLLARMQALTLEQTGSFWHMDGTPLPW